MTKNKIENEVFVDTSSLAIRRLYISRTPNVSFNTTYSKNSNRTSINAEQHSNLICVTLLSRSCKSTQKKHSASDSQVDVQCQRRRRQRGTHTVPEKQQITRGILGLRTYEPFLRSDAPPPHFQDAFRGAERAGLHAGPQEALLLPVHGQWRVRSSKAFAVRLKMSECLLDSMSLG